MKKSVSETMTDFCRRVGKSFSDDRSAVSAAVVAEFEAFA
jgi:hypothetical protein